MNESEIVLSGFLSGFATEGMSLNGYSTGYWIEKEQVYEDAEYKDYYVYMAFIGRELDHVDMTPEAVLVNFQTDITGIYVRYEIDGKLYRALYDTENKVYKLVATDK